MVSWNFLDWLEMGGNELVVQSDIGLEFSGLLDLRFHPECRFELQMGRMSGSDVRVNPGSCFGGSANTGRHSGTNLPSMSNSAI